MKHTVENIRSEEDKTKAQKLSLPTASTTNAESNKEDGNSNDGLNKQQYGLANLPNRKSLATSLSLSMGNHLNPNEFEQFLRSTTNTIITSCPNGGPVATVTVPITSTTSYSKHFTKAEIRIMTNAGQLLSTIDFPPLPTALDGVTGVSVGTGAAGAGGANHKKLSRGSKLRRHWFVRQRQQMEDGNGNNTKSFRGGGGGGVGNSSNNGGNFSCPIYTPNDIFTIGFTGRCTLIVILRDSLCLTYTLSGKPVLDPFYIFHNHTNTSGGGGGGGGSMNSNASYTHGSSNSSVGSQGTAKRATMVEVIDATIYDGGVAVLCSNMTTAIVELLDSDEESDTFYREGSHLASRVVKSVDWDDGATAKSGMLTGAQSSLANQNDINGNSTSGGGRNTTTSNKSNAAMDDEHNTTSMYALITPLSTSTHAKQNYITYTSIAVLPRIHTQSRHPEIFLGTSNNSVIVCDTSSSGSLLDVYCQERITSPVVKMKFAPNGRFLACFTKNCIMTVISTNFETKVLDFDTADGCSEVPHNMEWCGEDSVVLHWKNLGVLMVGPYGDWLRFPYENVEYLHLSAEMDCCRVVTDHGVQILQRVPPATAAMLRIGSIEPAAMLLDASDAFENGSPASDEAARAITKTGLLMDATAVCTDAATREFDVKMQKRLLKAASYGMHFEYKEGSLNNPNANPKVVMGGRVTRLPNGQEIVHPSPIAVNFVESAKKIRVLNALHDPSVGVAMTVSQYDAIGPNGVIARLIAMKRPALATSLSNYLQLDESIKAYARASRASAFVTVDAGHTDAETAEAAMKILNAQVRSPLMNRSAYATVALAAFKADRPGVAKLLLTLESSVADKVPALTTIGLHSDAAAVAADAK